MQLEKQLHSYMHTPQGLQRPASSLVCVLICECVHVCVGAKEEEEVYRNCEKSWGSKVVHRQLARERSEKCKMERLGICTSVAFCSK